MKNIKFDKIYESDVAGVNNFGNGVCDIDFGGQGEKPAVVFVPEVIDGDKIKLRIVKAASNRYFGEAVEIIEKSPYRIEPDCGLFGICGGCDFRNTLYSHELELKKSFVESAMRRSGFKDVKIDHVVSSGEVCGYRSKVIVRTDKNGWGYYKKSTYEIAHQNQHQQKCRLHSEIADTIIGRTYGIMTDFGISMYDEKNGTGILRGIYIREARGTEEIMLCLIINSEGFSLERKFAERIVCEFPRIKGVFVNENRERTNLSLSDKFRKIYGDDYIEDILCGLKFRISPKSFYQVNHKGSEILYFLAIKAAGYISAGSGDSDLGIQRKVADLYCGTGTIGMCIAKKSQAAEVTGVEIERQAIDDAVYNANLNGIKNIKFVCGDAKEFHERADTAVIDPPRKGCSDEMIDTLIKMSPKKIVYVSCNPETMARDAKKLCVSGKYSVVSITPVDMFPRTVHVECVMLMSRVEK